MFLTLALALCHMAARALVFVVRWRHVHSSYVSCFMFHDVICISFMSFDVIWRHLNWFYVDNATNISFISDGTVYISFNQMAPIASVLRQIAPLELVLH